MEHYDSWIRGQLTLGLHLHIHTYLLIEGLGLQYISVDQHLYTELIQQKVYLISAIW